MRTSSSFHPILASVSNAMTTTSASLSVVLICSSNASTCMIIQLIKPSAETEYFKPSHRMLGVLVYPLRLPLLLQQEYRPTDTGKLKS